MHEFTELVQRSTSFTLSVLRKETERLQEAFETSAATTLVKQAQMIQLQKAISAVGIFSIFEAMLQDGLKCTDGFLEAGDILKAAGHDDLAERFVDLQKAINVLKHGRGRSYDTLVQKAHKLRFRVKLPDEAFFFEGDISEISTLIEVDDAFVIYCAEMIWDVSAVIRAQRKDFSF